MDELLNNKKEMTAADQIDHEDEVTELDNMYKDLLNQAKKLCAILEGALKTRQDYADSVKELQDCLDACVYELPVLEQPGVPIEEKLNKCQVGIWLILLLC